MKDNYLDINEAMVEYSEMNGFDFAKGFYKNQEEDCLKQAKTLKKDSYEIVEVLKSMFRKVNLQKS